MSAVDQLTEPQSAQRAAQRQRLIAWVVLLSSFALFCLLIYGIFQLGSFIYDNATTSLSATVQRNTGSDLTIKTVSSARFTVPFSTTTQVNEGDSIRTGADTQADIAFPDGSMIHIFPNSQLTINQIKASRFSRDHVSVIITQQPLPNTDPRQGSIIIVGVPQVTGNGYHSSQVVVNTATDTSQPVASVSIDPYSTVRISTATDPNTNQPYSRAMVQHGSVQVSALPGPSSAVPVGLDQMATVGFGGQPSLAAAWDEFLVDGNFAKDGVGEISQDNSNWGPVQYSQGGDGGAINGVATISDTLVYTRSEHVAHFYRCCNTTDYASVALGQRMNRDLSPYLSGGTLQLSADVKLLAQGLPGGGVASSEFPIIFKLTYENSDNNVASAWEYGYYFVSPQAGGPPVKPGTSEQIQGGQWVHIEISNLLAIDQLKGMKKIVSLEVYAAGHDYEMLVTNISLAAR